MILFPKFFLGLEEDELAEVTQTSKRTAQRDWQKARAFLADYLAEERQPAARDVAPGASISRSDKQDQPG